MTTFNEMVEEVLINLEGFTLRQDRTTYLTAGIDSDDLSLALASGDNIGKGIVEIDDSLHSTECQHLLTDAQTIRCTHF